MSDKKISQLTALSAANLAPSTDVLAIVDTSATETKKIVAQDLVNGVLNVASAVGIGTASPGRKLDVVAANNTAIRALSGASGSYVSYGVGRTAEEAYISVAATANNFITGSAAGDLTINNNAGNVLITAGGSATQLYLNTSGNLGLGVTPSAWASGNRFIDVNASASYGAFGSTDAMMLANAFWNGSNWVRKNANNAFRFVMESVNSAPAMTWQVAANSTAGSTISWTQAMTLDADGDLAIGATSASDRLHVERNWNGSTWVRTVNTDSGAGAAAGMLFKNNTGDLGAISLLSSANSPADSLFLRSLSTNPLAFGTNNTERGRFTAGGYFKASNAGTYVNSTGTYHEFNSDDGDDAVLFVRASEGAYSGNVLIPYATRNTTNNSFYYISCYNSGSSTDRFRVADSGNVTNTNGSYGTISDVKMKTDIVDAGSQWDDIKAVRFRKFKMKDDPDQIVQLGVVAQELEQTSPGLVDEHQDYEEFEVTDNDGNATKKRRPTGTSTKSVKTSVLLMKAAVALQEAMARIEQLEADMAALKGAK